MLQQLKIMTNSQPTKLILKIATSREKLQPNFPSDPRGDIQIIFQNCKYKLQKAYLRLDSRYFKQRCGPNISVIEIKENFKTYQFQKVLSLFYGFSVPIDRAQVIFYYPIAKFLQIQCLVAYMKKDILANISHYDIFSIIKIAQTYSDQQLFEACHEELHNESFEQLKYQQFELLHLDISLFKLIIKAHNQFKTQTGRGLSFVEIDNILKEYCEINELKQDKYRQLKFEIIDLTSLNSSQYKLIFLDDVVNSDKKSTDFFKQTRDSSNMKESLISLMNKSMSTKMQSSINQIATNNQIKLQMQNTFEKKRNQQLLNQNIFLEEELTKLKKITSQNQDNHCQMENQLNYLRQQLRKKQAIDQQQKRIIKKFETIFVKMQRQLEKKTEQIDMLSKRFEQLKTVPKNSAQPITVQPIVASTSIQNNIFVQSQFLPAHLIGDMMLGKNQQKKSPAKQKGTYKTTKKSVVFESLDEQQIEQLYLDRIVFDEQPKSIHKKQLPRLSLFITTNGFRKKHLNLIYRRSKIHPQVGNKSDIRNKNQLLVLINTQFDQHIGGYVSVPIPASKVAYVEDKGAFLFSLTKNKNFYIKPTDTAEAIFMSESYLISFANDLMISTDCLAQKSYCFWPNSYAENNIPKDKGPMWLAGGSQFLIKDIEIYEINEADMEMML